ncbi:tRNA (guanine(10)-N2)-methyltransferase homolog [Striga asiatica]|uniref:tRNA (Guanine(10)-N2)-methyltransferase homolog n=1 Tax=Striga asiatica TaxID=4170 RepID=A0A5A7QGP2_STRAF|nr:tRNA (guanine(10)-N2)-methyltransferase homolog [Striga asiatica]
MKPIPVPAGEEVGPKLARLLYFVGAGVLCTVGINKWKEFERKSTIVKEQQLNGESTMVGLFNIWSVSISLRFLFSYTSLQGGFTVYLSSHVCVKPKNCVFVGTEAILSMANFGKLEKV